MRRGLKAVAELVFSFCKDGFDLLQRVGGFEERIYEEIAKTGVVIPFLRCKSSMKPQTRRAEIFSHALFHDDWKRCGIY